MFFVQSSIKLDVYLTMFTDPHIKYVATITYEIFRTKCNQSTGADNAVRILFLGSYIVLLKYYFVVRVYAFFFFAFLSKIYFNCAFNIGTGKS